jgi:UDP-N-acetylglucosamine/UDP-N-acetylgalactosamine diphosphorylase
MIRALTLTIAERLEFYHQEHLLQGWETLPIERQSAFARELEQIDFDQLVGLFQDQQSGRAASAETPAQMAFRAQPPAALIRQPKSDADRARWQLAHARGEQLLKEGRVAAILVAGGQGTRLGFDRPKGMFPIGPVSNATLFQLFCEQILARSRHARQPIPYYIMTSDATHADTVQFFAGHRNFGLPAEDVVFFQQGTMPAVDATTGRLLLSAPGQLAMSPDGHGGLLQALQKANLLDEMAQRGIDFLYYHQVDNPQAIVVDPAYLGWHALEGADVSTKVVAKTGPEEKMGVAVDIDHQTQIIEYSDLPNEVAERRNAAGELDLWAGSTAIHVFSREFLSRLTSAQWGLPFHVAHKAVPYYNPETGAYVSPEQPNAFKFERFIFDVLPEARKALVVEADRNREFAPLKNASGPHSPSDVKRRLVALHSGWLTDAGVEVPSDTAVEISPLIAVDAAELAIKLKAGIQPTKVDSGLHWKHAPNEHLS